MTTLRASGLLAALPLLAAGFAPASAQFDQGVLMKWAAAEKIRYEVVGEFTGAGISVVEPGKGDGVADVKDRVELVFTYSSTGEGLLGEVKFKDFPSEVSQIRHPTDGCAAPSLSGAYEHHTIQKVEDGYGGYLHVTSVRQYPAAEVAVLCSEGRKGIPAATEEEMEQFTVPAGTLLALMEGNDDESLRVFPDRDTIVVTEGGWTWTYKLTPAN